MYECMSGRIYVHQGVCIIEGLFGFCVVGFLLFLCLECMYAGLLSVVCFRVIILKISYGISHIYIKMIWLEMLL